MSPRSLRNKATAASVPETVMVGDMSPAVEQAPSAELQAGEVQAGATRPKRNARQGSPNTLDEYYVESDLAQIPDLVIAQRPPKRTAKPANKAAAARAEEKKAEKARKDLVKKYVESAIPDVHNLDLDDYLARLLLHLKYDDCALFDDADLFLKCNEDFAPVKTPFTGAPCGDNAREFDLFPKGSLKAAMCG